MNFSPKNKTTVIVPDDCVNLDVATAIGNILKDAGGVTTVAGNGGWRDGDSYISEEVTIYTWIGANPELIGQLERAMHMSGEDAVYIERTIVDVSID